MTAASLPISRSDAARHDPRHHASVRRQAAVDSRWLVGFAAFGVLCQVGMFLFGDTPLRMPLRIGIYGFSLLLLIKFGFRNVRRHPAAALFQFIFAVLLLAMVNPYNAGLLASAAQTALYVAVLAPLLWIGGMRVDRAAVRRLLLIFWAFYSASAAVGALQVAYPHRFDGATASNIDDARVDALSIATASGDRIVRPKGLTDTPGGAGQSGLYAIIFGLGLMLTERSILLRATIVASMGVGLFAIYLAQGRTNIVLAIAAVATTLLVLLRRGEQGRFAALLLISLIIAAAGTMLSFNIGGTATIERWNTLLADDPTSVAYSNRGHFLDDLIRNDLFRYPLGAGSGRWGMMNAYFGDGSPSIWVEMMWQALLYDGGVPLMLLFLALLTMVMIVAWQRTIATRDRTLGCWGAALLGFNIAAITASFSFPVFIKDAGLQLFLLNACFHAITAPAVRHLRPLPAKGDA